MSTPDYLISTPENVDLHLELAGLGNRVLACLIDTFITYTALILLGLGTWLSVTGFTAAPLPDDFKPIIVEVIVMLAVLVAFFIMFGYYIFFEGRYQGQTPGKRVAHIRVVDQNGQPVTWGSVFIRNLVRVFDEGLALIGMVSMIIDKNERRFGDMAAGTIVIRERLPEFNQNLLNLDAVTPGAMLDVGRVTPQEYDLLVGFLRRREKLARSERPLVAKKLAEYFHAKMQETPNGEAPEAFLERVYQSYQSRAD